MRFYALLALFRPQDQRRKVIQRRLILRNAGKFREKIKRHQICIGAGITFYDPTVTDALCGILDFVWIDMEHNALTLEAVQAHIMATQASDTTAIVRIPSHDPALIKTILDIGADGIIAPNVRTPDEARKIVQACRYPPDGIRGFGPRRASNYGRMSGPAFCKAANEAVLAIAQIEHIDAVRDIDEILAVPGLDSIVFGPNDLSGSMGCMGEPKRPEVVQAMETVMARARIAKFPVGSGAGNPNDMEYWIKQGVDWILTATDYAFMLKAASEAVETVRRLASRD
jgi:2-keto-3-deoxy-L-rhamnonate aldolase RhmA